MTSPLCNFLVSVTLTGILAGPALAQPRAGRHSVPQEELASAINYWTAERRASAVSRDIQVDPLVVPQGQPRRSEPSRSAPGALPTYSGTDEAAGQDGADGYWTPERRDAAIPKDMAVGPASILEPLGFVYPYPFSRYNVLGQLYTGSTRKFPYTAVGKLFFTLSGINYVCSASVIRPHLLLTARHCVFDYATQVWATNVLFYPGYLNGANAALGNAWAARLLMTWTSNAPNYEYDIGFIQTFNYNRTACAPVAGNLQIESYTGYLGYKYGGDYSQRHFDPLGYPAAAPFNGTRMVQCEAATGALNQGGYPNTIEIGCDATGGTSGGPWLDTFVPGVAAANNYAASLNSFRFTNLPLALNGPQFLAGNFNDLLTYAMGQTCP